MVVLLEVRDAPTDSSRREALSKSQEQSRRSLDADLPAQQSPDEIPFLRQEPQPRSAVGRDRQVGIARMAFPDVQCLLTNRDRRAAYFRSGEGELIRRLEPLRSIPLECQGQPVQK